MDYRSCQYISPTVAYNNGPCDCLIKGIMMEKVLNTTNLFQIQALCTVEIPLALNTELKVAIQEAIKKDRLTGQLLKEILTSGP